MLRKEDSLLVIVDVQGKLAQIMDGRDELFKGLENIVAGCKVLELPIIWMEQNPTGLGPTIPEIAYQLPDLEPLSKDCFSCCGSPEFMNQLNATGRKQVLLVGIEAHICVYQTAVELMDAGYEVHLVTDAVSSRTAANRELAIRKMESLGAQVTGVEMALFELQKVAEGKIFRKILKIIK